MQYSVLMSVYKKENPEFLSAAINSILSQTVPTDDFVIVCDGPLTDGLETKLSDYEKKYQNLFHIVRLTRNMGLGIALNEGLQVCKHHLVARMDSDDISVPNRMELQLDFLFRNPSIVVCGGQIAEFEEAPVDIVSIRKVPCSFQEISCWAKKRNPMNHMSVMFNKDCVMAAGSYQPMDLAEDYYLWIRMLMAGYRMENLDEILVKARIGNGMYRRRGGLAYAKKLIRIQKIICRMGFINKWQYLKNVIIRMGGSLLPSTVRKWGYKLFLRK